MQQMIIHNPCQTAIDVQFCFEKDHKGQTFLLEPSSASLQPGEQLVWKLFSSFYPFRKPRNQFHVLVMSLCVLLILEVRVNLVASLFLVGLF